jgi:pyroglutamyl-peptidase
MLAGPLGIGFCPPQQRTTQNTSTHTSNNAFTMSTEELSMSQETSIQDGKNKQRDTVRFIVTGFGPFGAVKENPTTIIVTKLFSFLRQRNDSGVLLIESIEDCIIMETSAQGVKETCDQLQSKIDQERHEGSLRRILLHLGVDERSKCFKLEACAYNQATFRIPDVRGFRPLNEPIFEDEQYAACLRTRLDVEHLSQVMTERFPSIATKVSTDPGRYVCNYVYCSTLQKFGNKTNNRSDNDCCSSLFLHVPPFDVVPEVQQLEYVASLLETLTKSEESR